MQPLRNKPLSGKPSLHHTFLPETQPLVRTLSTPSLGPLWVLSGSSLGPLYPPMGNTLHQNIVTS